MKLPRQINLEAITEIAEAHRLTLEDILGKSRHKYLVMVRRKCVVMLREKGYSTTEIGRIMKRDHSTIVHALQRHKQESLNG
ncbi:helix-turn-helix domain-containing protein [Brevundimonas sp.]|jgi:chromosomal replication initiation ATPase DnaA|uniref:helix-turn-helix domain-containing protein n=1 Tax=Brevundimonas sp. TaxID=1871086 RepID=UPI00378410F3